MYMLDERVKSLDSLERYIGRYVRERDLSEVQHCD